ncbi:ABC transporter ATP-binding protein [Aerococcus tenax]|uniref:ABC transporter ATP-binding protein n=1 Tax=Aerococcus tenax TaxID=3078812 RepID=UPI0018A7A94F|nr:ABC transporter ATP-binding protein [Aerococcus tenax]
MDSKPLLSIKDLQVAIQGQTYVKDLSLDVYPGERLGLVGPSGAGKSLTVKAIMNFQDQVQVKGHIYYQGLGDIVDLSPKDRQQALPQEIAVIQQEALDSLNPHYDIGFQLELIMKQFQPQVDKADYPAVFDRVLKQVNLNNPDRVLASKPAQLSGGMKQRIVIAMALLQKPRLILADEPTTALDQVNQETFIDLIKSVSQAENIAVLFISHNLELVSQLCNRLVIIDQGQDIETNSTQAIFNQPQAPTTQRLVDSVAYRKAASQDFVSHLPQGQELVLKTQDLSLHYPGADKPVLQEVNLDLYPGEFVGLVGESGSGKSSLAKLLTGLYPKSQGQIIFKGQVLDGQSLGDFQAIQMIFQNPYQAFDSHYRMGENLKEIYQIPSIQAKYPSQAAFESKLEELAQRLKLDKDLMAKSPKQLSGGQGQRFAILRILLAQPDVIIADEILSALDWEIALELIDLLKDLQKDQDFAMLFISHDLAMVKILCQRIYQIEAGRLSQL